MGYKFKLFETLVRATAVGLQASAQQPQKPRKKKECTPCAATAMVNRAKQSARTGRL